MFKYTRKKASINGKKTKLSTQSLVASARCPLREFAIRKLSSYSTLQVVVMCIHKSYATRNWTATFVRKWGCCRPPSSLSV